MIETLQAPTPPTHAITPQSARDGLAAQLDVVVQFAQRTDLEVARFYCMALVLREAAEADAATGGGFDSHGENQIARGRGNVSKPTDLRQIFTAAGIAEEKLKTAYRWFSRGEELHAQYARAVGAKFAKSVPMPALVLTPAAELSAEAQAKVQMLFDFLADARREAKARGGWKGGPKGPAVPETPAQQLERLKQQMFDWIAGIVDAPAWAHRSWTVLNDPTLQRFAVLLGKRAKEIEQHIAMPKAQREALALADAAAS